MKKNPCLINTRLKYAADVQVLGLLSPRQNNFWCVLVFSIPQTSKLPV